MATTAPILATLSLKPAHWTLPATMSKPSVDGGTISEEPIDSCPPHDFSPQTWQCRKCGVGAGNWLPTNPHTQVDTAPPQRVWTEREVGQGKRIAKAVEHL